MRQEVKNIIVVESSNDKAFVEALLAQLNITQTVSEPIFEQETLALDTLERFSGEEEKEYNGLSEVSLTQKLKNIKKDIDKLYPKLEKIGIMIDADAEGVENRKKLCNKAIENAFGITHLFSNENELKEGEFSLQGQVISLKMAFYCVKVNGEGELSTLLKQIKKADSPYADCLEEVWKPCYEGKSIPNEKRMKPNQFSKLWVEIFLKYDNTNHKKRNKDSANLALKLKNNANELFDLEADALKEIKTFLSFFL